MRKPRLLDAYCGQGGATRGYQLAGFHVTGVDVAAQPRYVGEVFHQGDAIEFIREHGREFDAIHASPPCHDHARSCATPNGTGWLLAATRDQLVQTGVPWIIENVPGAPMRPDYRLCGCMFDLPLLKRERWFETSWHGFDLRPPCHHPEHPITVVGENIPSGSWWYGRVNGAEYTRLAEQAMGINWMTRAGLSQAIPPSYTRFIGEQLRALIERTAA